MSHAAAARSVGCFVGAASIAAKAVAVRRPLAGGVTTDPFAPLVAPFAPLAAPGWPALPAGAGRYLALEVFERLERPVDTGEPEVRDLVELAQRAEDRQPDLVARHLGGAAARMASSTLLAQHGESSSPTGDLAGLAHAGHDLRPG
jgi:hypothetical protein